MHSIYNLARKELPYHDVFFQITIGQSWIFVLARDQREFPDYCLLLESSSEVYNTDPVLFITTWEVVWVVVALFKTCFKWYFSWKEQSGSPEKALHAGWLWVERTQRKGLARTRSWKRRAMKEVASLKYSENLSMVTVKRSRSLQIRSWRNATAQMVKELVIFQTEV